MVRTEGTVHIVGLSHHTAPIALRERFAVPAEHLGEAVRTVRAFPGVAEAMILSTCNRVELYAVSADRERAVEAAVAFFRDVRGIADTESRAALRVWGGDEAVRHAFLVASGLDSMVIGETQILGQVRAAFATSRTAGSAGPHLDALLRSALAVGRRVRRETGISRGTSVPAAAAAHASRVLGPLRDRRALIIGAGKMAEVTVRALARAGLCRMVIASRTSQHAEALAAACHGQAARVEDLGEELVRADLVITCAAAPHRVLSEAVVAASLDGRASPLVIIDIAVPRNVDPDLRRLPGVSVYDVDDLRNAQSPGGDAPSPDVEWAKRMVDVEVGMFLRSRAAREAAPLIAAAREEARAIIERELARVRPRLVRLTAEEDAAVRALVRRVVNKILHRPIVTLAEAVGDRRLDEAPVPRSTARNGDDA
jgi:glutamyl-tRNA reductase